MNHDPEKNRAACVIAKGSVWALRTLLAISLLTLFAGAIAAVVIKIREDWNWYRFGSLVLGCVILIAFAAFLWLIAWLVQRWYGWARNYSKNC